MLIFGEEDRLEIFRYLLSHGELGDVIHCVLHQVKLASLLGNRWQYSLPCRLKA